MAIQPLPAFILASLFALPIAAQRGGQDQFRDRYTCYFVETKLPPAEDEVDSKARLATLPMCKDAKEKGQLVFLYLYDSSADEPKRAGFDQIIFGTQEIGISLLAFRCAHVDIAGDADAQKKWGHRLPLFVTFDDKGKWYGEMSLPGYKAALRTLSDLLDRSASSHVKPSLPDFSKAYRDILRELRVLAGRRTTLEARRNAADEKKKVALEKEFKELEDAEQKLKETEQKVLEKADLPPRDPEAKPFGVAAQRR